MPSIAIPQTPADARLERAAPPSPPAPAGSRHDRGPRANVAATLLASSLLAAVGFAPVAARAAASPTVAAAQPRVEVRIQEMHAKLQITAAQEDLWKVVAQTMRDNQLALDPLVAERAKNAATATAPADLDSFAAVSEAHAAGIRKFAAAFEPLYSGMTDAQKAVADDLFRNGPSKMGKSSGKTK